MKVKELINLISSEYSKVEYISYDLTGNALDTFIIRAHDTPIDFLDIEIDHLNLAYYLEICLKYNGYFDHYNYGLKNE